ncbi:MAG TPA: hypothetical protein VFC19_00070 [Candidatus Limnocylindrales bacterium]|nr:hypothetical protein [Candidatus Limnocylindrales bacterium]
MNDSASDLTWPGRLALLLAVLTAAAGMLCLVLRWDMPSDGTEVTAGWSKWLKDAVVIEVPGGPARSGLTKADAVLAIDGVQFREGVVQSFPESRRDAVGIYRVRRGETVFEIPVRLGKPNLAPSLKSTTGLIAWLVALGGLAVWLRWRRPRAAFVTPLLVCAAGLVAATLGSLAMITVRDVLAGNASFWLYHLALLGGSALGWGGMLAMTWTTLQPQGRRVRPQLVLACYFGPLMLLGVWAGAIILLDDATPAMVGLIHLGHFLVTLASLAVGGALGILAYLSWRRQARRPWLDWIAAGSLVSVTAAVATWLMSEIVTGDHQVPARFSALSGIPFVAATGFAVLRYRLLAIERLVSRSLAYGALVSTLLLTYVTATFVVGVAIRPSPTVGNALVTVTVAVTALAVHNVLRQWANRVVYGSRDNPDMALAEMGRRLSRTVRPDEVLYAIAETIAKTMRLPFVAIEVTSSGRTVAAHSHGRPVGPIHEVRLEIGDGHARREIGRLKVSARDIDEALPIADQMMLDRHHGQIAMALKAVRADLSIQETRSAERWELGQRLHNLVKYQITAIAHLTEGGKSLLCTLTAAQAEAVLDKLESIEKCAKNALAELERIVKGMRPATLERLGLVRALRTHATAPQFHKLEVTIEADGDLESLPAETEIATYQIAVEAMNNARQHAHATRVTVSTTISPAMLDLRIHDDGTGDAAPAGMGRASMSTQAEQVGGFCVTTSSPQSGTTVHAALPLNGGHHDLN